jgi:alkanesulfonate monooxygenase SsuD/methylene tetrahydromethanopterin reductase-like flavin-dependent oxidoreductase (luciferase family)
VKLGVAFAWHVHPFEDLLDLVQRAERLGYAVAYVDGDATMLTARRNADVLDGWTVTTALLAATERIQIASIRLVHHWNAGRLAQAVATAERLFPGRYRFLASIGDRSSDSRFGLPDVPASARIVWLDETLTAVRRLLSGDTVTMRGHFVQLDRARIRPAPPEGRVPIAVAGRRPRMLELVAKHADLWDVNLPPIPEAVERAAAILQGACERQERFADAIARSMLIYTRVAEPADPAAELASRPSLVGSADLAAELASYRKLNPWFDAFPDESIQRALVVGSAAHCRLRLAEIARELRLDLPIVDLSGLDAETSRATLEALAPGNNVVDAGS